MWNQLENRREIDYLMANTDPKHVMLVLDTGHIYMAGIDPVELSRALGHRVLEYHLKETKKEWLGGAKQRVDNPDMEAGWWCNSIPRRISRRKTRRA